MAKTILTQKQQQVLKILFDQQTIAFNFYLTGGTALAEYYLHHRYSEDLDFFSTQEVDTLALNILFKEIKQDIDLLSIDYQQRFNRNLYFLHFPKEILKTEFTYYPGEPLELPNSFNGIRVDSLLDITINKLFTIYQNPRSRDFIDLYLILKQTKWKIADLRIKAKTKFDFHIDPLQLATQFMKVDEVKDYPRMLIKLDSKIWQEFWIEQAKQFKDEVFK